MNPETAVTQMPETVQVPYAWHDDPYVDMPRARPWKHHLVNALIYGLPAVIVTLAMGMLVSPGPRPVTVAEAPQTPVPVTVQPMPATLLPSPQWTDYTDEDVQGFFASLRNNQLPIPPDAEDEARSVCDMLAAGHNGAYTMDQIHAAHPDWTGVQVGGFSGASVYLCRQYSDKQPAS